LARSTPQTHAKRQREQDKSAKRRLKIEKRAARKAAKQPTESDSVSGADSPPPQTE
jgi:hypothetical protein